MAKGDREILKADLDDGYTPIANLILEALALAKMSGVQKGLCMFLFRRTYGWNIKEDEITLREFADAVGSSVSYVSKQLKQLIKWKIITRPEYKPGKTPTYAFNTRVMQWDKGCLNVQGLNDKIKQGLYKCSRVALNKRARVEQGQSLDGPNDEQCPKESIKDILNTSSPPIIPPRVDEDDEDISVNPFHFYENNFGTISSFIAERIIAMEEDIGPEMVVEAMKIAVLNRAQGLGYVEAIIRDWLSHNIRDPAQLKAYNKHRKDTKQNGVSETKPNETSERDITSAATYIEIELNELKKKNPSNQQIKAFLNSNKFEYPPDVKREAFERLKLTKFLIEGG